MEPIIISPAQLRACQVLRSEVERLIQFYREQSADCGREAAHAKQTRLTDWAVGFHEGRAQSYELAAEFLAQAVMEADK